jgi:hypothetical protein
MRFLALSKFKKLTDGQRFADILDIQNNATTLLPGIQENDFQDRFRQWHHRLKKGTASQEEYFVGNSSR